MTAWNQLLRDQFEWHWENQLRARLEGMTDEEYLWEPVPGAWSVRPRGTAITPMVAGAGDMVIDWAYPAPTPAPVTTIARRLRDFSYAATAAEALSQVNREVDAWLDGVRGLGEDGLDRPCGPAEGPFVEASMATLVLHIHRELIHHLAEVSLLRDLYAHTEV